MKYAFYPGRTHVLPTVGGLPGSGRDRIGIPRGVGAGPRRAAENEMACARKSAGSSMPIVAATVRRACTGCRRGRLRKKWFFYNLNGRHKR